MSKLLPFVAGITGTTIITGVGGYLLSTQVNKTIKESFKDSLIDLKDNANELLKKKLKKLQEGNSEPENHKLKEAKKKKDTGTDNGLDELKAGCQEIYDSKFVNRGSNIFKDFQSFCSWNIKDKFDSGKWAIDIGDTKWNEKHTKLKSPKSPLVSELKQISKETSQDGNKLKAWCQKTGDLIFEGEDNETYKNINEFCTKDG